MDDVAIKIDKLQKVFRLPHEKRSSVKSLFINFYRDRRSFERQEALKDISLEINRGEFFGIIGRNGSGKSTLLKLLAEIYTPTEGTIEVNGSLTPFIELGVGFNPELTGRENVYLNGALLGFNRKDMRKIYSDIVEFAELEKFMDQKLKNYSSGMQVRLAFSIAIRADSDILLIDEVLAVGDALFQQKCYDYFEQLKKAGKTIVFISHDMGAVESFCDRAALLDQGKLITQGHPQEVIHRYGEMLAKYDEDPNRRQKKDGLKHIGAGGALITKGSIINSKGETTNRISEGEPFAVRIYYEVENKLEDPVIGIGIMGKQDQSIIGPNTKESGYELPILEKRGYVEAHFKSNPLSTGTYRLRASIMNTSVTVPYDFVERLLTFTVIGKKRYGDIYVEPKWSQSTNKGK